MSQIHGHMARDAHGLPKVLLWPAMPNPSMPCTWPALKQPYSHFWCGCPKSREPAADDYPLRYTTPYTYAPMIPPSLCLYYHSHPMNPKPAICDNQRTEERQKQKSAMLTNKKTCYRILLFFSVILGIRSDMTLIILLQLFLIFLNMSKASRITRLTSFSTCYGQDSELSGNVLPTNVEVLRCLAFSRREIMSSCGSNKQVPITKIAEQVLI
jgi:hypothetical protein